jgi:ParB family chromosome partitioning protein
MESHMSRRDELLAKTARIKSIADIPDIEVPASDHVPRSGQGSFHRRQKMEERVAELEARLKRVNADTIPLGQIEPNPWQPRRVFDQAEMDKLVMSIRAVGLMQPIVVRCVGITNTMDEAPKSVGNTNTGGDEGKSVGNTNTRYQIIAGERRYRAHKILGEVAINVIVTDASDADMATLALVENFGRDDLTAFEMALSIRNAETNYPNRKNMAECLGVNRSDLYDYLAYFDLPDFVVSDLEVNPTILGRSAAKEITVAVKKHGEKALASLHALWPRVKSGDLDQGKIAATIETRVTRKDAAKTDRDIKKLFVGNEHVGSITRDAAKFKIEIKTAAMSKEQETEVRAFVEKMFAR